MRRKLLAMDIDGTAVCDDYSLGKKEQRSDQTGTARGT